MKTATLLYGSECSIHLYCSNCDRNVFRENRWAELPADFPFMEKSPERLKQWCPHCNRLLKFAQPEDFVRVDEFVECAHEQGRSCNICSGLTEGYEHARWIGGKWVHRIERGSDTSERPLA